VFRRVVAVPGAKRCLLVLRRLGVGECDTAGALEVAAHTRYLGIAERQAAVADQRPFGLDAPLEFFDAQRLHQDLDARLREVVAASLEVVHPQDGLEIREQVFARQEVAHHLADDGRAAEAAARKNFEAQFAIGAAHDVHSDVMHQGGRPVLRSARDGDLEFARQVGELGMKGRPLANDFAPRARIVEFVRRHSRQMVRRGVADAVAAGLNGMHFHGSEVRQNIRHFLELSASCTEYSGGW
jgi:hypothetical protein